MEESAIFYNVLHPGRPIYSSRGLVGTPTWKGQERLSENLN